MNVAYIKLWGQTLGAVSWNEETRSASFEYDQDFLKSDIEPSPLKMPLSNGKRIYTFAETLPDPNQDYDTFKGLPGMLSDSLPDRYGAQLINAWLAQQGRPSDSLNPVELLCYIGSRGMGALEFVPVLDPLTEKSAALDIAGLVEIASEILNKRGRFSTNLLSDTDQALSAILSVGTSAGGARPKAVIAYNDASGEVRSGQVNTADGFEHWLIKFDGVSDTQFGEATGYGRVEYAYYLMAKDCGIDIMPSRLLEEGGRAHFMTRRFDREGRQKHHIQTFCALRHFDYNLVGVFSYEQLFETMRLLRLSYPEAEQMFRRMVFNILARNCDDHTKNFAFMLKQSTGKWQLAPAYDLCFSYREDSRWVSRQSLSVNGKRDHITDSDLLKIATSISCKNGKEIVHQVRQVVKNWENYATQASVSERLSLYIDRVLKERAG